MFISNIFFFFSSFLFEKKKMNKCKKKKPKTYYVCIMWLLAKKEAKNKEKNYGLKVVTIQRRRKVFLHLISPLSSWLHKTREQFETLLHWTFAWDCKHTTNPVLIIHRKKCSMHICEVKKGLRNAFFWWDLQWKLLEMI